jgi:4-carboxymuconolactone decarboxylase
MSWTDASFTPNIETMMNEEHILHVGSSASETAQARGQRLLETLHGGHAGEAMLAEVGEINRDFVDMTIEWAFGGIMSRPGLDLPTRQLILIASCVTSGNAQPQLRAHAEAALRVGVTRQQIIETILQLTFYAGGPAVRNSLVALKDVLAVEGDHDSA